MISFKNLLKNTALLCTMLTAGVTLAEDGVVRMSDRSAAKSASGIQQASCTTTGLCGETYESPQPFPSQCWPTTCFPPLPRKWVGFWGCDGVKVGGRGVGG